MPKSKIAIVGCGDVGGDIALLSRFNRKLKTIACVDPNLPKAEQFARKHRIPKIYQDYGECLEKEDLAFLHLAVPHHLHYPMILQALEKGVHVFCEKPITNTLGSALELCRIVGEQDQKVGVNYQYRYDKACYALARAAHRGDLGEIYYIRCNVPWCRKETYFSESSWHAKLEQSGGGTLITQASHMVDIALWIAESRPQLVTGLSRQKKYKTVEVEDLFMGTVETESGCQIELCSSMVATPERCVTIEVYGSKATGVYEGHFFPKVKFLGAKIKKEKPAIGGIHALSASLEGFRRWVVNGAEYAIPIQSSLEVLATVSALYRAAETGKTETVDTRYLAFLENVEKKI